MKILYLLLFLAVSFNVQAQLMPSLESGRPLYMSDIENYLEDEGFAVSIPAEKSVPNLDSTEYYYATYDNRGALWNDPFKVLVVRDEGMEVTKIKYFYTKHRYRTRFKVLNKYFGSKGNTVKRRHKHVYRRWVDKEWVASIEKGKVFGITPIVLVETWNKVKDDE